MSTINPISILKSQKQFFHDYYEVKSTDDLIRTYMIFPFKDVPVVITMNHYLDSDNILFYYNTIDCNLKEYHETNCMDFFHFFDTYYSIYKYFYNKLN